MSVEYVYVGAHADILSSGRTVGPGDRVAASELEDENGVMDLHHKILLDDGILVDATSFPGPSNTPEGTGEALAAKARELNIKGRSTMSADELRAAVADAETEKENA